MCRLELQARTLSLTRVGISNASSPVGADQVIQVVRVRLDSKEQSSNDLGAVRTNTGFVQDADQGVQAL